MNNSNFTKIGTALFTRLAVTHLCDIPCENSGEIVDKVSYSIALTSSHSDRGSVAGEGTYKEGSYVQISATEFDGCRFVRWSDGNTNSVRTVHVTQNIVLQAIFDVIPTYSVSVSANDDTYGTVSGGGTFREGQTITISATPNQHYEFVKWSDNSTEQTRMLTVNGNLTLQAVFAAVRYNVTLAANNSSYGYVNGTGDYSYGSTVTISATPSEGYRFVRWSDGVTASSRSLNVSGDVTIQAIFEAIPTYTVTLSANDASYGEVSGSGTVSEGSSVTISAVANDGYEFVKWSDDVTEAERTITVNADVTLQAIFAAVVVTRDTDALLENYSKEFTEDQKDAFKTFVDGLKSDGIWDNIQVLYMPALAGDVSECCYNLKTATVDSAPAETYYELKESGMRSLSVAGGKSYVTLEVFNPTNTHLLMITNKPWIVPSSTEHTSRVMTPINHGLSAQQTISPYVGGKDYAVSGADNYIKTQDIIGYSCDSNTVILSFNGLTVTKNVVSGHSSNSYADFKLPVLSHGNSGYSRGTANYYSAMSWGTHLTSEQILSFNSRLKALISALA